jgi:hypothetical protein
MWPEVLRAIAIAAVSGFGGAGLTVFAYGRRQARAEWNDAALTGRLAALEADINGIGGKVNAVLLELRSESSAARVKFAVLAEHAGVSLGADRSFPPQNR